MCIRFAYSDRMHILIELDRVWLSQQGLGNERVHHRPVLINPAHIVQVRGYTFTDNGQEVPQEGSELVLTPGADNPFTITVSESMNALRAKLLDACQFFAAAMMPVSE